MDESEGGNSKKALKIADEVVQLFARRGPRDPARIEAVLNEIGAAWRRNPDLRFHQLIAAVQPERVGQDNFYQEDEVLLADLRKFNSGEKV